MYRQSLKALPFLPLLLIPLEVSGLPDDRTQPVQLQADRAQFNRQTGISVYEGKVVVTQGSMRLTADTATVHVDEGEFKRMEAQGKPATLRYKPAVDKEEIQGFSQRVEYDAVAAHVVMITNAKVIQGKDIFTGDRVEYDINKDLVKATSKSGEQVHFTIQPKTAPSAQPNPGSNAKPQSKATPGAESKKN